MTPFLKAVAMVFVVIGVGAGTVTLMKEDVPDLQVPSGPWEAGSKLDGRVFHMTGAIAETGAELPETVFTFADGRFQSSRCQIYCEFGWTEYQTWANGDVTHFTVTTRCPDAPHTVVWYGTVSGDEMRFSGTWTTRRWYWTRQMTIVGEGAPAVREAEAASG